MELPYTKGVTEHKNKWCKYFYKKIPMIPGGHHNEKNLQWALEKIKNCEGERFLAGIFFLSNAHILHMTYYTLGAYLQMH